MGLLTGITDAIGITDTGAGDRAYSAQAKAAGLANQRLEDQYEENKSRTADYRAQGGQAFGDIAKMARSGEQFSDAENPMREHNGVFTMDDYKEDPGYKFRMQEGQKALERSAAARGNLGSSGTMKALARYGQNLASQEYQSAYNRFNNDYSNSYNRFNNDNTNKFNQLNTIANYGQNANSMLAGQGMATAQSIANNELGLGNAKASAEMSRGNDMKDLLETGATAAAAFCWVAREVFGETNPKWLEARDYVLNIGPKWFKNLYQKHGEAFARVVAKKPLLKWAITPVFEYFAFRSRLNAKSKGVLCQ